MSFWKIWGGHTGIWFTILVIYFLILALGGRKVKIELIPFGVMALICGFFSAVAHRFILGLLR